MAIKSGTMSVIKAYKHLEISNVFEENCKHDVVRRRIVVIFSYMISIFDSFRIERETSNQGNINLIYFSFVVV